MSIDAGELSTQNKTRNLVAHVISGDFVAKYYRDNKGQLSQVVVASQDLKLTITIAQTNFSFMGGNANIPAGTATSISNSSALTIKPTGAIGKITFSAPLEVQNSNVRLNGVLYRTSLRAESANSFQLDLQSFVLTCISCSLKFSQDLTSVPPAKTTTAPALAKLVINNNSIGTNNFKISGQIDITNISSNVHLDHLSANRPDVTVIKLQPAITKPTKVAAIDRIELQDLSGKSSLTAKELKVDKLTANELAIIRNPNEVNLAMQTPSIAGNDVLIGTGLNDPAYVRLSCLHQFYKTLANAEDNPAVAYQMTLSANNGVVEMKETKQIRRDPNVDDTKVPAVVIKVASYVAAKITVNPFKPLLRSILSVQAGEATLIGLEAALASGVAPGLAFGAGWLAGVLVENIPVMMAVSGTKYLYESAFVMIDPYAIPVPSGKYIDLQKSLFKYLSDANQPPFLSDGDFKAKMSDDDYSAVIGKSLNQMIANSSDGSTDPNAAEFSSKATDAYKFLRQQRMEIQARSKSWEEFRTKREQVWLKQTKALETLRSTYQYQLNYNNGVVSQAMQDKKDAVFNQGQQALKQSQQQIMNYQSPGFESNPNFTNPNPNPNPNPNDPNCPSIYYECWQTRIELHPPQTQQ